MGGMCSACYAELEAERYEANRQEDFEVQSMKGETLAVSDRDVSRLGDWRTFKIFGRPWQDLIFAVGEVVFLATLIPMLFRDTNVPLFSGIGTAFMLYTFLLAHVSYRNWITVTLTFFTATLWVLIGLGVHI
jgi:hypothetical protein